VCHVKPQVQRLRSYLIEARSYLGEVPKSLLRLHRRVDDPQQNRLRLPFSLGEVQEIP
jgi:hypothetical protein